MYLRPDTSGNFAEIKIKILQSAVIRDGLKFNKNDIEPILQEVIEIANIIAASLLTMKEKR